MWLSRKFTELRVLLDEEETLTKNYLDEKTQQALQAYSQQAESCKERIKMLDNFSGKLRQIQQQSDPVQLLEVLLHSPSALSSDFCDKSPGRFVIMFL